MLQWPLFFMLLLHKRTTEQDLNSERWRVLQSCQLGHLGACDRVYVCLFGGRWCERTGMVWTVGGYNHEAQASKQEIVQAAEILT